MVPSLERSEYMYELREIGDNIARERCKQAEVNLGLDTGVADGCKVADAADVVEPGVAPTVTDDSPSQREDVDVGPAFHIPMTQEKTLGDLPSQLDFDWQESESQGPRIATSSARNIGEDLDGASTTFNPALPGDMQVESFVQVSQIAHEAVMDATTDVQPFSPITTNSADASNV